MPRDRSFKSYVANRFYNELYDGIQEFIKGNPHDLDLTLYRVRNIDEIELSDIQVVFVDVHDQPGTGISFDVAVDAEIGLKKINTAARMKKRKGRTASRLRQGPFLWIRILIFSITWARSIIQ